MGPYAFRGLNPERKSFNALPIVICEIFIRKVPIPAPKK